MAEVLETRIPIETGTLEIPDQDDRLNMAAKRPNDDRPPFLLKLASPY